MPIVLTGEELARIARWTDPSREDPDAARRKEYLRYLDETSKEMTKSWPNSLENVNRRNEELRLARAAAAERANSEFYERYVKRQRERRRRMLASARDLVFRNKDAPKMLLSAVIETCVLKEREQQLEFLKQRREEAAERRRREDEEVARKAREWREGNARRRRMRLEADRRNQQEVLEQAHEVSERNRIEHETELQRQQLDNLQATQQVEAIKQFEIDFKASEKARIQSDMQLAKREAAERRERLAARDKMDDQLVAIVSRAKDRVDRRRVETENNIRAAKQKILDSISAKLESGDAAIAAKEHAILEKAHREKEEKEQKIRQQKRERAEQSRRERAEQREQWLREEQRREQECNARMQWECMNRFKNLEIYEEYQKNLKEEKARKIKEYREDMLRLWKERTDREAAELEESRRFHGPLAEAKLRAADDKLLAHARELIAEARANGRPERPLLKAVDTYCRQHRLYPSPGLPASLQEHFDMYTPRDGTQAGGGGTGAEGGEGARNGLQDTVQPSTSNNGEITKEAKTDDDYKRVGRANGLQGRNAETEVTLPPITVVPCQKESCSCPLNQ